MKMSLLNIIDIQQYLWYVLTAVLFWGLLGQGLSLQWGPSSETSVSPVQECNETMSNGSWMDLKVLDWAFVLSWREHSNIAVIFHALLRLTLVSCSASCYTRPSSGNRSALDAPIMLNLFGSCETCRRLPAGRPCCLNAQCNGYEHARFKDISCLPLVMLLEFQLRFLILGSCIVWRVVSFVQRCTMQCFWICSDKRFPVFWNLKIKLLWQKCMPYILPYWMNMECFWRKSEVTNKTNYSGEKPNFGKQPMAIEITYYKSD